MRRVLMLGLTLALLACSPSGRPVNPHWSQLTEQEQSVLAPLQPEWNRYNPRKKQEFLALVGHWASLTPAEQTNVQLHLYDWALMEMPDRQAARRTFDRIESLPPPARDAALAALSERERVREGREPEAGIETPDGPSTR